MSEIAPVSRHNEEKAENSLADKIRQESIEDRKKLLVDSFVHKEATTILPPKYTGWKTDFPVYLRQKAGGKDINGIQPGASLTIIGGPETTHDSQIKGKDTTHFWYKVRVDDASQLNTKAYGEDNEGWVSAEFLHVNNDFALIDPNPPETSSGSIDKDGERWTLKFKDGHEIKNIPTEKMAQKLNKLESEVWYWGDGGIKFNESGECVFLVTSSGKFEEVRSFIEYDLDTNCKHLEAGKTKWIQTDNTYITKLSTDASGIDISQNSFMRVLKGENLTTPDVSNNPNITSLGVDGAEKIIGLKYLTKLEYLSAGKTKDGISLSDIPNISNVKLKIDGIVDFQKLSDIKVDGANIEMSKLAEYVYIDGTVKLKKQPDMPYGIPIPGRSGFVNSPFAAKHQLVDVRGLPIGMEVKCPYTGKLFRVPPGANTNTVPTYTSKDKDIEAVGKTWRVKLNDGKTIENVPSEDMANKLKDLKSGVWDWEKGGIKFDENGKLISLETNSGTFEMVRGFIQDDLDVDCTNLESEKTNWIRINGNDITKISTETSKEITGLNNLTKLEFLSATNIKDGIILNELPNKEKIMIYTGVVSEKLADIKVGGENIDMTRLADYVYIEGTVKKKATSPDIAPKEGIEKNGERWKVTFIDGKTIENVPTREMAQKLKDLKSGVWDWDMGGIKFDTSGKLTGLEVSSDKFEDVRSFIQDDLGIDCTNLEIGTISYVASNSHGLTNIYTSTSKNMDVGKNVELERLSANNAATVTGIEHLTKLTDLSVFTVSKLNVSKNIELRSLSADRAKTITGLENLVKLTKLSVDALTTLDVAKNTELTNLSANAVSTLDVAKNTELVELTADNVTTLDVSGNTKLMYLSAHNVTALDISKNTNLRKLFVHHLNTVDVSNNPELEHLWANNAEEIIGLSNLTKLEYLSAGKTKDGIALSDLPNKETIKIYIGKEWKKLADIEVSGVKIDTSNLAEYVYIDWAVKKKTPDTTPNMPSDSGDTMKSKEYSIDGHTFTIEKDGIFFEKGTPPEKKKVAKFEGKPEQNGITKLEFTTEALPDQIKAIIGNQNSLKELNIVNVLDKNIQLDLTGNKSLANIEASWENNLSTWKFPAIESQIKLGDTLFNIRKTEGKWIMNGPTPAGSSSPAVGPYDITQEGSSETLLLTPKKLDQVLFNEEVEKIPGMDSPYIRYMLNRAENSELVDGNRHSKFKVKKLGDAPDPSGTNIRFDYIATSEGDKYNLGYGGYEKVTINSTEYSTERDEIIMNVTPDGSPPIDITYGK